MPHTLEEGIQILEVWTLNENRKTTVHIEVLKFLNKVKFAWLYYSNVIIYLFICAPCLYAFVAFCLNFLLCWFVNRGSQCSWSSRGRTFDLPVWRWTSRCLHAPLRREAPCAQHCTCTFHGRYTWQPQSISGKRVENIL